MEILLWVSTLNLWGLLALSMGCGVTLHILSFILNAKEKLILPKGEIEYLVVCNQHWVFMWGLFVDADKDDTEFINRYVSKGWTLHSFSLRNSMISNISFTKVILISAIYILTLGYVNWISGSIFIFERSVEASKISDSLIIEPSLH